MPISSHPADRPRAQVLIVEDESEHAEVMAEALRSRAGGGHVCTIVGGVDKALEELKEGGFDVVVTDLRMPDSGGRHGVEPDGSNAGFVVLESVRRLQPHAVSVMVTAHGDVATARAALKVGGAYDFIEKPLDLAVFREVVNRAAEEVLLRHEAAAAVGAAPSTSAAALASGGPAASGGGGGAADGRGELTDLVQHDGFEGIIAGSEPMRRILSTVRAVAASTIPVLITGESGTGKELVAQAVHRLSPRAKKRFVAFNCAGQSESLLEDALFGHVRGAFTGADKEREGVFEYATGGTLFLDEIGDMPLTMQAKLLRVLETGEVVRLGSNEPRKADVRFVSATNKDLQKAVADGTFRQDLYFRIQGAHIALPPLRDRRDDIPRIARHAVVRFAQQYGGAIAARPPGLTDAAMMRLTAYSWPGNVRQLLNVVQNMLVMAVGEAGASSGDVRIDVRHIPAEIATADPAEDLAGDGDLAATASTAGASLAGTSLEQIEKRAIRETLGLTGGNREKAAELLGIGERTLYRKLKEYGLR